MTETKDRLLKICVRKNTDTHYEMFIKKKNDNGYVFNGVHTSCEDLMKRIAHMSPDIEMQVIVRDNTEDRYDFLVKEYDTQFPHVYPECLPFFISREAVLEHISFYMNNDNLELIDYKECEEMSVGMSNLSISGGITKFFCSSDDVLKVDHKGITFETWTFRKKNEKEKRQQLLSGLTKEELKILGVDSSKSAANGL